MKIVQLVSDDQLELRSLGRNSYEVNGQITVSDNGRIDNILSTVRFKDTTF